MNAPVVETKIETLRDAWLLINGKRGHRPYPLSRTTIRDAVRDYGYDNLVTMDHNPCAWGARIVDHDGEPACPWAAAFRTEDDALEALETLAQERSDDDED